MNDAGVIEDARFKTFGCGSAIASSSLATEWIKGKSIDDAETIKNVDIVNELNLPPVKIHCSVLAEDAIKSAIADYRKKQAERRAVQGAAGHPSSAEGEASERGVTMTVESNVETASGASAASPVNAPVRDPPAAPRSR